MHGTLAVSLRALRFQGKSGTAYLPQGAHDLFVPLLDVIRNIYEYINIKNIFKELIGIQIDIATWQRALCPLDLFLNYIVDFSRLKVADILSFSLFNLLFEIDKETNVVFVVNSHYFLYILK